jgi:hypothetical protein
MRQLQKGDQGPRQRDHRRIRLASVLILRTLRKADYRFPEETQASSAQDDQIAAHRIPDPTMDRDWRDRSIFAFFPRVESTPRRSSSPNFKSQPFSAGKLFYICLRRSTLDRMTNPAHFP